MMMPYCLLQEVVKKANPKIEALFIRGLWLNRTTVISLRAKLRIVFLL